MRTIGEFSPLFRNPHLATIAGNFWRRELDLQQFPANRKLHFIEDGITVVSYEHRPFTPPRGQIVFLHGLEGSADAGYIQSFAQDALLAGYIVHRMNLRTCGDTEDLCRTMYHSGLTQDTIAVLRHLQDRASVPLFLVGFSLGGNVALKLAGELGEDRLLSGVCAISTPIDLAACVARLGERSNFLYSRRFLRRLRDRVARKSLSQPDLYSSEGLETVGSILEFDDRYTAPLFGFQSAAHYYETQSAQQFLEQIRTPTLCIAAADDPLVPIATYDLPVFDRSPWLDLVVTKYGGHVGFISRRKPRFWVDTVCLQWIGERVREAQSSTIQVASADSPNLL